MSQIVPTSISTFWISSHFIHPEKSPDFAMSSKVKHMDFGYR